ncbi:MAG: acetylornithine deacetylase [Pseudomonadota bacterium]
MLTRPAARLSAEEILAALIGFDTTSRDSNLPLIAWVEDYLNAHGVRSFRVMDETDEKANLFATIGPEDAPGIILSGHTDTVPVDGQDWSSDPYRMTERDGRLYGRGTADMKGFLACCLAAVPDMAAAPLATPLHLALSYDEEVGCLGVVPLIDRLASEGRSFAACFVGEPTGMQVVTAHKTKRSLRAVFHGLSCHSSLAPEGVNAVSYAAQLVAKIDAIAARLAEGPSDPLFDTPVSTAHVGVLNGGTALNIVPERAEMVFEFRVLPGQDADALVEEVTRFVRETLEPDMRRRHRQARVDLDILSAFPGLDTPEDSEIVSLAKRLAQRNDHAKVAFGTEGGRFAAGLGVPTVVVGPGAIAQAHIPDEFIETAQLRACEAFLSRLIQHCSGPA